MTFSARLRFETNRRTRRICQRQEGSRRRRFRISGDDGFWNRHTQPLEYSPKVLLINELQIFMKYIYLVVYYFNDYWQAGL